LDYPHEPVLVREVLEYLEPHRQGVYVDGTVGSAGHSLEIGKSLAGQSRLICLDRDRAAIGFSEKRLAFMGDRASIVKASYADLDRVLETMAIDGVDGVLLDLGMSSFQLDHSGRGFSFGGDEPLDMRMDQDQELSADRIVNTFSQKDLAEILWKYGEEKRSRAIAGSIVRARMKGDIRTSSQLAELIKSVYPPSYRYKAKHPAVRSFQALRIAVNSELQNIELFLRKIPSLIKNGGRLVVISYHSLEDRMIKRAMNGWEKPCTCPPDLPRCACGKVPLFRALSRGGVKPGEKEIDENPRARSAILRAAERI